MKQLAFDFTAPAQPSFDNFIRARNAEAVQHLESIAARRVAEPFVYLWGAAGSGRTHLMSATLSALRACGAQVAYVASGDDLLSLHAPSLDAVAVDDVERLSGAAQIALFHLYNALRENGGALLAAGDVPPARLSLRGDLVTRFAWGLVYEIRALSDAEKALALTDAAKKRGFRLQPEVVQYLLNHTRRDMRSLMAMVASLDRFSLEAKRPVSLSLLRELLAFERA